MSADEHLGDQFQDYRMDHQPNPDGQEMHDLNNTYPDIHEHPEYYAMRGERADAQSMRAIRKAHGNPEQDITVYRGAPPGVSEINHGDWVTPSKEYAQQHGRHATDPKQDWPVLKKLAKAKDLRGTGDSINEWGYFPHPR